jgi:hypothetical protein
MNHRLHLLVLGKGFRAGFKPAPTIGKLALLKTGFQKTMG